MYDAWLLSNAYNREWFPLEEFEKRYPHWARECEESLSSQPVTHSNKHYTDFHVLSDDKRFVVKNVCKEVILISDEE